MSKKNKLVCGIGVNDADYCVTKTDKVDGKCKIIWVCPFYVKWESVLRRCYSSKLQEKYPTYRGCFVCKEWLTFSKFRQWMETQDWEGRQLDKDILVPGNKLYGPETCVFIDGRTNTFIIECNTSRGQWMLGVHWDKSYKKFRAQCRDLKSKKKTLGRFDTEIEAHQAWLKCKQEVTLELAAEQTDPRVAKALIDSYENYAAQEKELDKS